MMSHLELSQEKYNNILAPNKTKFTAIMLHTLITQQVKIECFLNCYHLQIIFKDLCEVVLQLRPSEVLQDFLPVWWVLVFNNQQ